MVVGEADREGLTGGGGAPRAPWGAWALREPPGGGLWERGPGRGDSVDGVAGGELGQGWACREHLGGAAGWPCLRHSSGVWSGQGVKGRQSLGACGAVLGAPRVRLAQILDPGGQVGTEGTL